MATPRSKSRPLDDETEDTPTVIEENTSVQGIEDDDTTTSLDDDALNDDDDSEEAIPLGDRSSKPSRV